MRKITLSIILFITVFVSNVQAVESESATITLRDAFEAVKHFFPESDANYFALKGDSVRSSWSVFVDPAPYEGWEHRCYLYRIPKTSPVITVNDIEKIQLTFPPNDELEVLELCGSHPVDSQEKPRTKISINPQGPGVVQAPVTYAVILSGGANKNSNYSRYWNDCSYLYKVLTQKYGIPKDHIFPIMADGANPEEDTIIDWTYGKYLSQSLDLDEDGVDEDIQEASKINVQNTFANLASKVKSNQQLFIFVVDHGGEINNHSYILLWNPEGGNKIDKKYRLYDYELAEMLKPFIDKKVNVNVVMGQCRSGGFVEPLSQTGCVIATACKAGESSLGGMLKDSQGRYYDDFVYHWINGINGFDVDGNALAYDPDLNNDGFVTMDEAFMYASESDGQPETPQYASTPISIGEDLALNRLPELVNLYIRDNASDTGKETSVPSSITWNSPDIWLRNQPDDGTTHEDIDYNSLYATATVYVTVNNRGINDYSSGQWLHLYWAKNGLCASNETWLGNEIYSGSNQPTGGYLTSVQIPTIPAGLNLTIPVTCQLPLWFLSSSPYKYGLNILAVISDQSDGLINPSFINETCWLN